jgi:hypothetical protein|nr:MAG TPA: hypothetical protein [Caudoviricetes sp.]
MTKEEMLKALKESNALNVKKAEDTLQNIETKEVKEAPKAEGITGLDSELPTQKEIEKEVAKDEGPMIPVDKDGVSKDGGEDDRMQADKVEAERKREDNGMKDVINVSSRKVEETAEVNNELLDQLKEAADREENYKEKIKEITALCEKALVSQQESLTKEHAAEMNKVFEAVIAEGEKMEKELTEAAARNEKMYKTAQKLYENSTKLNKILIEAVKKAQPEKQMTRYMTPARRAVESLR